MRARAEPSSAESDGRSPASCSWSLRSRARAWLMASFAIAATACCGCGDSRELRTPSDAKRFVADIARGGKLASWRLASNANGDAARAWDERATIQSVGRRLHTAGPETWSCDLAEGMAVTGGFGEFTPADRLAVTSDARFRGADRRAIDSLISEVATLAKRDWATVVAAACGQP